MKKTAIYFVAALMPVLALAFSSGPPNGMTGAPGEANCTSCHDSFPVNSGNGGLTIDGPSTFEPGRTYEITVTISDPGQRRWGFEITPLTIGTCTITQAAHTQLSVQNNRSYVKHTTAGTFNGTMDGPISWRFNWTAPLDAPDQVAFYAAGNAANGNGNNSGDYIYTTSFSSNRTTDIDDYIQPLLPGNLALANYPNPFNSSTEIRFNLPGDSKTSLEIYDITGRSVKIMEFGHLGAGLHSVQWDGTDYRGQAVSSGIYLIRLAGETESKTHRVLLLK